MVARECKDDPDRQQLDCPLAGRAATPQGVGPGLDLRPLAASRCRFVGARGSTLYLTAPDGIRAWVERRYSTLIAEALVADRARRWSRSASPPLEARAADKRRDLNPSYTFERFVIGDGNRLAHARRAGRRRGAVGGLQPALPPRPARARQDPPAGRRSPTTCRPTRRSSASATRPPSRSPTSSSSALHSNGRRGLQAPLPRPRRAADRRRPVPRGQGRTPRRSSSTPSTRSMRAGARSCSPPTASPSAALDARRAAARPLRVGPDRRRSSRPTSRPG